MPEKKKMVLELNKPVTLELLYDSPVVGQSQYGGDYYLYGVKNGSNAEYSLFAPDDVHEILKTLRKGSRVQITKLAEQVGKKIVTKHEVKVIANNNQERKENLRDHESQDSN